MLFRSLQTLTVIMLALVVACAENTKQDDLQVTSSSKASMRGKFDDRKALEILYGSFDPNLNGVERSNIDMPPEYAKDPPFSKGIARPVFSKTFIEKGEKKRLFLAGTAPENYNCHACVPIVSGAFFAENNGEWAVESKIPVVALKGSFGKIGECTWQEIGNDRFALVVSNLDGGQGYSHKSWDIFEFEKGLPRRALSHTDDFKYPQKLETSLTFDRAGKEMWDAVVTARRKQRPIQRYVYEGGKYVKASLSAQQN